MDSNTPMPSSLPISLDGLPKLSKEQAGHIRHYHNMTSLPHGNWNYMWSEDYLQESMDAYRYQLANLVYGAGLAHYHRLPALRSVFKPIIRRSIEKMLLRDVWGYWFNTSQSGRKLNPDLKEPRKPWADPVIRENIMYSGHLILMTSLYAMLFDDDQYEKDGSITFDWAPQFWGNAEKYGYSTDKLQEIIISEMEKNKWLGVCCEPNVVFVICNQFPLIAIRYNDARHGTHVFDDVIEKYKAAWKSKEIIGPSGQVTHMWMVAQDQIVRGQGLTGSAWSGSMMNSWNSDFVYSLFEQQRKGFLTNVNGKAQIQTIPVGAVIRKLVDQDPEKNDPDSENTVAEAIAIVNKTKPKLPFEAISAPTYGFIAQWLSELGKEQYLNDVLEYADNKLQPVWEKGGLYYQRNSEYRLDEPTYMDPVTSNTSIAYSRLNIKDGQKIMFEKPWTPQALSQRPFVDGVDLSQGVDFLRGVWDENKNALVVTIKAWDGKDHELSPRINNLSPGAWGVYINGNLKGVEKVIEKNSSLSVPVSVGAEEELDLVLIRGEPSASAKL